MSQFQGLALVSSKACLLLLHKPNPLLQSSEPPQDSINQQAIGSITQSTPVESALCSLHKSSNKCGDNRWTSASIATPEEEEVGLALVEQVNSPSTNTPSFPRPYSITLLDEIES